MARSYSCALNRALDASPSPEVSSPNDVKSAEAAPVESLFERQRRASLRSRNPSAHFTEPFNIPGHERARPPRSTFHDACRVSVI
jgi:hypothetical protein